MLDLSRQPLAQKTEELLQLVNLRGRSSLLNPLENYCANLSWDAEHFPSLLLWISNHGRQQAPWPGRNLALGVESICSAFELGLQISGADNPITLRGIATARTRKAKETFVTRYRIEIE